MISWELYSYVVGNHGTFDGNVDATKIWGKKQPDGSSQWDDLQQIAKEGWELAGITPIAWNNGVTRQLLYTFKRPLHKE